MKDILFLLVATMLLANTDYAHAQMIASGEKEQVARGAFDFDEERGTRSGNVNVSREDEDHKTILALIEKESTAFWDKDYETWASCWVHEPYIRTMGWWDRGGVTVVRGWEERGPRTKEHMKNNPEPNPQNVRRENINMRVYQDAAWVTFDQYGNDTGEPDMDMPGLSRETRFLEKHNGEWKIVYVGWLLEGESK